MDETTIEIGKTKEGLNILDLLRFGPILNCLDFIVCYGESSLLNSVIKTRVTLLYFT